MSGFRIYTEDVEACTSPPADEYTPPETRNTDATEGTDLTRVPSGIIFKTTAGDLKYTSFRGSQYTIVGVNQWVTLEDTLVYEKNDNLTAVDLTNPIDSRIITNLIPGAVLTNLYINPLGLCIYKLNEFSAFPNLAAVALDGSDVGAPRVLGPMVQPTLVFNPLEPVVFARTSTELYRIDLGTFSSVVLDTLTSPYVVEVVPGFGCAWNDSKDETSIHETSLNQTRTFLPFPSGVMVSGEDTSSLMITTPSDILYWDPDALSLQQEPIQVLDQGAIARYRGRTIGPNGKYITFDNLSFDNLEVYNIETGERRELAPNGSISNLDKEYWLSEFEVSCPSGLDNTTVLYNLDTQRKNVILDKPGQIQFKIDIFLFIITNGILEGDLLLYRYNTESLDTAIQVTDPSIFTGNPVLGGKDDLLILSSEGVILVNRNEVIRGSWDLRGFQVHVECEE